MSRIFLTGDVHATNDIIKIVNFADTEGKTLTKDDKLIILGDFGFIFDWNPDGNEREEYWLNWFDKQPWTTLFLDGNHENFNRLNDYNTYPLQEYYGGKVSKINDSLFHLLRGEVYNFNNNRFLILGGADSIDRYFRVEDFSWWRQETISRDDINLALKNAGDGKVDYVLTHAGPTSFLKELYKKKLLAPYNELEISISEKRLERLKNKIDYNKWYCGHYHCDYSKGNIETLYNKIIELPI